MSAGSSRPGVIKYLAASSADTQPFDEYDIRGAVVPRPGITRHYTSLKDHAIAVHDAKLTPGGGELPKYQSSYTGLIVCKTLGQDSSTPRVEDRREGFTWEFEQVDEPRANDRSPHPPRTPPTLEELSRADSKADAWEDDRPRNIKLQPFSRSSTKELPLPSSIPTPSRTDTNRSSVSDIARGMRRHIPDLRMFYAAEKKSNLETKRPDAPLDCAKASPTVRQSLENASERMDIPAPILSQPPKITLKDRRQLPRKEAMKLTLPLELPKLPPRSRVPVAESYSLVPSQPRSPKTPWLEDQPPEWRNPGLKPAPAPIFEAEESIVSTKSTADGRSQPDQVHSPTTRPSKGFIVGRFRRETFKKAVKPRNEQRGNSLESHIRPALSDTKQTSRRLKEQGTRSRSRRFRWGFSNDLSTTPHSEKSQSSLTLSRFLKPKRQLLTPPLARLGKSHGCRKQSMTTNLEALNKMPIPPTFVPPGLNRVPTPPMFDSSGEVKGKLADFFFDLQGVHEHRVPAPPGGFWDSDVLLMSQHADLEQNSSASEESPRDPIFDSTVDTPNLPLFPSITTPTGGAYTAVTPPHYLADVKWSQVETDPTSIMDAATRGAEEIAKLEWLIPEHLPNSPLCPLHAKYRGSSKGLCVYHGKWRSPSDTRTREQMGQIAAAGNGNKIQRTKSDMVSRRENSALDGSEDVDEVGGFSVMVVSKKSRARKRWFHVL